MSKLDYKWRINIVLISFPFFLLLPYASAWFCFTPVKLLLDLLYGPCYWKKHTVAMLRSILCVGFDMWVI